VGSRGEVGVPRRGGARLGIAGSRTAVPIAGGIRALHRASALGWEITSLS